VHDAHGQRVSLGGQRDTKGIRLANDDVRHLLLEVAVCRSIDMGQREDKRTSAFRHPNRAKVAHSRSGYRPEHTALSASNSGAATRRITGRDKSAVS